MAKHLSTSTSSSSDTSTIPAPKRQKLNQVQHCPNHQSQSPLIPGLPDHVAQICLSLIQPSHLYHVCRSWRRLIYSPNFPPFLSLYAILSPSLYPSTPPSSQANTSSIQFFNFDPISSNWDILPQPPREPPLGLVVRHPSFLSRNLPIQSISVSNNLVLLAATTQNLSPALSQPLIFNPLSKSWTFGPPLDTPRRWCALGTSRGAVYVASGIGSHFTVDVARSMEKWDLQENKSVDVNFNWKWEKKSALKDARFSRDAIDAVGWRGKICMVNVKGDAPKEGVVYDIENDLWEKMPEGMISGWRGPATAMDEKVMYVVDEVKGALRKYNEEKDMWEQIIESQRLRRAEQVTAKAGRVCVVSGGQILVVDVVSSPARLWVVDLPTGFETVAVHVLPRMPVCTTSIPRN